MKKKEFTKLFARHANLSSAEAADHLDRVVNEVLRRLRAGEPAKLPGLGTLSPQPQKQQTVLPIVKTKKGSR